MDQDGHLESHQFLTDGKNLVLTPRFAPNNQTITYMEYKIIFQEFISMI